MVQFQTVEQVVEIPEEQVQEVGVRQGPAGPIKPVGQEKAREAKIQIQAVERIVEVSQGQVQEVVRQIPVVQIQETAGGSLVGRRLSNPSWAAVLMLRRRRRSCVAS